MQNVQVVATYEQQENSAYLSGLDRTAKTVIDECAGLIHGALQHFTLKYHGSAQPGGSGSRWRDTYKKVEWSVREKERVQELREKLCRNTERLTLLNGLAVR
jgi:hypothetical protein